MKVKELRNLTDEELVTKKEDLKAAIFSLLTQRQLGKLERPTILNLNKKDIAKINTILRERELAIKE